MHVPIPVKAPVCGLEVCPSRFFRLINKVLFIKVKISTQLSQSGFLLVVCVYFSYQLSFVSLKPEHASHLQAGDGDVAHRCVTVVLHSFTSRIFFQKHTLCPLTNV